jgi:hypothetical protein
VKWDKVDKTMKKHVETFLKTYETQEGIEDILAQAKQILNGVQSGTKNSSKSLDQLSTANNAKKIKKALSGITIKAEEYDFIEEHIIRVYNSITDDKGRKNFWKNVQLGSKDKELEKRIKQKVGVEEE